MRRHYPVEFVACLKRCSKYLGKHAVWPMDAEAQAGVKAMKQMARRVIHLAVCDEIGALDGTKLLNGFADGCCHGWGAMLTQMGAAELQDEILGSWSSLQLAAQLAWPTITSEFHAQLVCARSSRSLVGRLPKTHWLDHANGILKSVAIEVDDKLHRWIAEIESDGSRLVNLSGRSMALGDA